jgi:hypothetical protein
MNKNIRMQNVMIQVETDRIYKNIYLPPGALVELVDSGA